jgi:hypothetical protein
MPDMLLSLLMSWTSQARARQWLAILIDEAIPDVDELIEMSRDHDAWDGLLRYRLPPDFVNALEEWRLQQRLMGA